MAILRAGPWGNLTDSFQNVPPDTSVPLDHYPVNCANANWPNQSWAAYYELAGGCCTPETVQSDWSYYMQYYGDYEPYTLTRIDVLDPPINPPGWMGPSVDPCTVYYYVHPWGVYHGELWLYRTVSGAWILWESTSSALIDYAISSANDPCDPSGVYTYTATFSPNINITIP
jgi:hypothetical protein